MKGHLKERSPGRWAIILDVPDPATGKRRRKWHSFKGTKRQAQVECARIITEIERGTHIEPNKVTLTQYLEYWLAHAKQRVATKTHERYEQLLQKNLIPEIGGTLLIKLKPLHISKAYDKLLTSGRRSGGGGLSPRTVHNLHVILKSALKQAVKWEMLIRNPADAVDPPRFTQATMKVYDLPQTAELIEAARGKRILMPMLLAVLCGLRRGEIAALKWRSIDLTTGQLAVIESAEQTKAGVKLKEPKSGRARTVAISGTIATELRAHRTRQAQELLKLGLRLSDDHFVVTQADGSPLQPHSLGQEWVRFVSDCGLPRIRFHDLRHAHATHLLGSGVHPKIASERLGHSKIGITLDLYSHVIPGMQEDAAARVDDALQAAVQKRGTKPIG